MDPCAPGGVTIYDAGRHSPRPGCGAANWSPWSHSSLGKGVDDSGSGSLAGRICRSLQPDDVDQCWIFDGKPPKRSETIWSSQFVSTSPQSTLTGITNYDALNPSPRSNGDSSSGLPSPPTPASLEPSGREDEDNAFDLLYSELLRLKMEDDIYRENQVLQLLHLKQLQDYQQIRNMRQCQISAWGANGCQGMMGPSGQISGLRSPSLSSFKQKATSNSKACFNRTKLRRDREDAGIQSKQPHVPAQCRPSWVAMRDDGAGRRSGQAPRRVGGSDSSQSILSNAAAPRGSGMRAVFLETPGARECSGTGVFLPRRLAGATDPKSNVWKPACSTVLLPSRIVQVLNLKVEDTLPSSPSPPVAVPLRRDLVQRPRSNSHQQARHVDVSDNSKTHRGPLTDVPWAAVKDVESDLCLPTEWTY